MSSTPPPAATLAEALHTDEHLGLLLHPTVEHQREVRRYFEAAGDAYALVGLVLHTDNRR